MKFDRNLGTQRQPLRIKLIELGDKPLLDIRKYFITDGDELPTKKGISLNVSQLSGLLKAISENEFAIQKHFNETLPSQAIGSSSRVVEKLTGVMLGRAFHLESKNGEREVIISKTLKSAIENSGLSPEAFILDALYKSLNDVLDEEDRFIHEAILDRLNLYLTSV
jgi:hypothetical protein